MTPSSTEARPITASTPEQAAEFFQALFTPGDTILLRPIEAWTENGQKKSAVDYKGVAYLTIGLYAGAGNNGQWIPRPEAIRNAISQQMQRAESTQCNVFFGVCPRIGGSGQYDQAWQIRTVRVLWSDVDDCKPAEALDRCKAAGLPEPSIVVGSGHGTHLYWLLAEPYIIDDAGAPPPVLTEWIDQAEGKKKKARKYIKDSATDEPLYLDVRANVPSLSPKAQYIQDVLAGVAAKIGGDHTTDLCRMLRVPGTLNRKDQRNDREPVPCTLTDFNPERRYPIDAFKQYAAASPDRAKRETIAKVKLPAARKLSATKQDKLNELLLACDTAAVGGRSEADFALCCWAIEHGVARDEVWAQAQTVGKFKEAGERYFDTTWSKAEGHTRQKIFDKATAKATRPASGAASAGPAEAGEKGIIKTLADAIQTDNHFAQDGGGKLYRYAGGVFRPKAESYVKAQVKRLCVAWGMTEDWNPRLASDTVEFIRVDAPELPDRPRLDLINVENGMLRIADGELLPHDPEYLSVVQLPVKFDPAATCPNIEAFINATFPVDAHDLAWEIPGVLMTPATWLQKAILLLGEGCNGKSVYLALLVRFLGRHNVSTIALHRLEIDKFSVSRLVGKLANICADLPSEHLAGTSTFKALTGGDTLSAEYKFKDSFDLDPFARLVFSANHPPRSADSSAAFFRRWVVIPFDHTFARNEQIPRDILDARLQAPEELSGLLNKAIEGLRRVQSQRRFSEPESVQVAWRDFHATTDSLAVWLDRYTVDDPDALVTKLSLRDAYNAAVERDGRPAMTAKAFGQALYKLRPNIEEKQRTVGGKLQWCYVGIELAHEENPSPGSRDSRDSPLSFTHAREGMQGAKESVIARKIEADPVNPVKPVNENGQCDHQDLEKTPTHDGYINLTCRHCGKPLGCRKVEVST